MRRLFCFLASLAVLGSAGCTAGDTNRLAGSAYTGGDMYDPDGRNFHDYENFSSFSRY
jgi:hypothetical protein